MPVLPEEVTATDLRRRWRGYDRAQVEALLGRVGTDYAGAIERVATLAEDRAQSRSAEQEARRALEVARHSAAEAAAQARRDADTDAESIRARAQRAAELIISQAEDTAAAYRRQADALREAAERDAEDARARLDAADHRARQHEDAARNRWDELRVETDARFEHLRAAERRFADRVATIEAALSKLRSQVALLDQVQQVEEVLAALRAETMPRGEHLERSGVSPAPR